MTELPTSTAPTAYQAFIEFWYKHHCPACKTKNWTYHSHSQRSEPIYSPEICKCHKCGQRYWLMSEDQVNDVYGDGEGGLIDMDFDEATGLEEPT